MRKFLVTTSYEEGNLNIKEGDRIIHLADYSKNFNFNFYKKNVNSKLLSKKSKKHCLKLTDIIFNKIYINLKNYYNINISKKAYSIILVPFLNNFIEIIYEKYINLDKIIAKSRDLNLQVLNKNDFIFFKNFSEFISFSQKDFFNFQIVSEIINFNKYKNERKVISPNLLKRVIRKIKILLDNDCKNENNKFIQEKKIKDYLGIYKIDFRHSNFLKEFLKFQKPAKKKINENFLSKINLKFIEKNNSLRIKIFQNLNSKKKLEKFIYKMSIKYLPSLYLESVAKNLSIINNQIKYVPKILISNAHGWWTDDNFKYYASFCIINKTKYIDVQHNGTYFLIDKNPHFEISKYFRDYFIGWGSACEYQKFNIKLPVLYSYKTLKKNSKSKKAKNEEIIFMGASVKRFFGGYFQSYLSGGNSFLYYSNQYEFLKNLSKQARKNIILRLRHNEKDPRGYIDFLKKKFSDLKYEDIKIPASIRLSQKNLGMVVVDHCSTPWLEVLFSNKPLILFWNNEENIINTRYNSLIKSLKNSKIYFDCPIAAAKRLEEVKKKSNYDWWYKDRKIQTLRKKLLNTFFFSQNESVKMWNKKIGKIFYEK